MLQAHTRRPKTQRSRIFLAYISSPNVQLTAAVTCENISPGFPQILCRCPCAFSNLKYSPRKVLSYRLWPRTRISDATACRKRYSRCHGHVFHRHLRKIPKFRPWPQTRISTKYHWRPRSRISRFAATSKNLCHFSLLSVIFCLKSLAPLSVFLIEVYLGKEHARPTKIRFSYLWKISQQTLSN